jgi:hypothetical protein
MGREARAKRRRKVGMLATAPAWHIVVLWLGWVALWLLRRLGRRRVAR